MILLHHLVFTAMIINDDVRIFSCPLVRVATADVIARVVALIIWMRFPQTMRASTVCHQRLFRLHQIIEIIVSWHTHILM